MNGNDSWRYRLRQNANFLVISFGDSWVGSMLPGCKTLNIAEGRMASNDVLLGGGWLLTDSPEVESNSTGLFDPKSYSPESFNPELATEKFAVEGPFNTSSSKPIFDNLTSTSSTFAGFRVTVLKLFSKYKLWL